MIMEYKTNDVLQFEIDTSYKAEIQERKNKLEAMAEDSDIPTTMEDISDLIKKMKFLKSLLTYDTY